MQLCIISNGIASVFCVSQFFHTQVNNVRTHMSVQTRIAFPINHKLLKKINNDAPTFDSKMGKHLIILENQALN